MRVTITVDKSAGAAPCGAARFHLYLDDGPPVTDTATWVMARAPITPAGAALASPPRLDTSTRSGSRLRRYPNNGCVQNTIGAWDGTVSLKTYS